MKAALSTGTTAAAISASGFRPAAFRAVISAFTRVFDRARSGQTARARRSSAQTGSRGSADRTTARAPTGSQARSARPAASQRATSADRTCAAPQNPIAHCNAGRLRDVASAAEPATGASIATAAKASERTQPPMPRLSTGMFATVQPANTPATAAFSAIALQASHVRLSGMLSCATSCARASGHRRRAIIAAANAAPASATPPSACRSQCGWFDTGAPQANFLPPRMRRRTGPSVHRPCLRGNASTAGRRPR